MDYKKKYNEAMERARELVAKWTGKNKDFYIKDYSYIFPELRESEDERIIEEIKFAVTQMPSERQDTKDRCLAWLEKQNEQRVSHLHPEDYPMTPGECIKPAWSEEDEKMLWSIINGLNQDIYEKERNWLANRLKSLRPQPKQEWSEEDERKIRQLVALLKSSKEKCMAAFYKDIDECIAWVCDLRPSWKPSEEQMEAFEESLMSVAYTENKIILESLLEQLKKLCK